MPWVRVLDVVAIAVIAGNVPITFCAFSYAGRLTVTAHADADRLLVSGMEVGWDRLANETRAAGE